MEPRSNVADQIFRFVIAVICMSALGYLFFGCPVAVKGPPAGPPAAPNDFSMCVEADPRPAPGSCGMAETNHGKDGPHYRCIICGDIVEHGCVDLNLEYCVDPQMGCDDPRCK